MKRYIGVLVIGGEGFHTTLFEGNCVLLCCSNMMGALTEFDNSQDNAAVFDTHTKEMVAFFKKEENNTGLWVCC